MLLAEAGTGTGKTLAYLVPAILNRQRVLISTGTKNLQEQIYFKDLPALRTALGVTFKAAYMKGRANYLCLHRLDQLRAAPHAAPDFISMMDEWRRVTESGDRAELSELPEDSSLWHDVSATAETCLGTDCPAVSRVLRHENAPARRRIRPGDRQSSPAVRGCIGAAEQLR